MDLHRFVVDLRLFAVRCRIVPSPNRPEPGESRSRQESDLAQSSDRRNGRCTKKGASDFVGCSRTALTAEVEPRSVRRESRARDFAAEDATYRSP